MLNGLVDVEHGLSSETHGIVVIHVGENVENKTKFKFFNNGLTVVFI
jgi:hypothetical protein